MLVRKAARSNFDNMKVKKVWNKEDPGDTAITAVTARTSVFLE